MIPMAMPVQFTTLYSELNIHHQPSVDSAVGMTQGSSTAPRIIRLNQSCWLSSRASEMPSTSLKATEIPVNTKAFWNVCRKASASQRRMKLVRPMKWLGRPMNELETEKYTATQNGYATSSMMRVSAGVMNSGPRTCSRSSISRTRVRQGRRARSAVVGRVPMAMVGLARHDLFHLGLGPGDRLLGRRAGDRLGDHVGQQPRVGDELYLVRRRRRPAVRVVLDPLAPQRGVLRIGSQDRVVLELLVGGQVEGVARHDVLVVLLPFAEQVADPLLGRVDVLAELPDPDVPRGVGLVAPVRAAEAPVVIDAVGGDQLALLGHVVGADRVVDPARLALLDRLVVARVRPRQHLGLHAVAEHLLVPLDRLHGGR